MRLKSLIVVVGGAMLHAVDDMPVALANHQAKPDFGGEIVYLILFMIGVAAVVSVVTYSAWNRRKRRLRRARRVSKQRKS
jgi:heme/copper-type cytochrome/quinol oxidase subunit 2